MYIVPGLHKSAHLSRTLVDHYEGEDGTVVAVLLFWVSGETDVLSLIFKSYIPQQDGDVVGLRGANKLNTRVENMDLGLHLLCRNLCFTQLYTQTST